MQTTDRVRTSPYSTSLSYCVYPARHVYAYHSKYGGRDPATTIQRAWRRYRKSSRAPAQKRGAVADWSLPDIADATPEQRFALMLAERVGALEERCAALEAENARLMDGHACLVSRVGYIWDTRLHNLQADIYRLDDDWERYNPRSP